MLAMQLKPVLIFGRGQLGQFYSTYFTQRGMNVVMADVDIRDAQAVQSAVASHQPEMVINVAGKTDIDWCERNKLEAFDINTLGAENVALACLQYGVYFIHVSSGCVQKSTSAAQVWSEDDPVSPLCYYAWTKVWAENLLFDLHRKRGLPLLVLRPRQLLSSMVSPRNAITKMLTYDKFVDTPNSCTIVEDLMVVTDELFKKRATGLYNVVNEGITTPYRIAEILKEIVRPEMKFVKIEKSELNKLTLATRVDCVLSSKKLSDIGIQLRPIEDRLREIAVLFKDALKTTEGVYALQLTAEQTATKLSLR